MASLLDHHQELNFQDLPGMITRVFNIYEPLIIRWYKGLMRFFFPKGIMSVRGGSILKMFLSGFDMFFQVIVCNETGRAQCKREDRSISKDGIFTLFYIEQRWVQTRHVPAIQNVCWAPHEKPKIATRGQLALCFRSHQCKGIEGIRSEKMVTEPTVWAVMSTASSRFK